MDRRKAFGKSSADTEFPMRLMNNVSSRILTIIACILIILGLSQTFIRPSQQHLEPEHNPLALLVLDETKFPHIHSERLVFPSDHGAHRKSGTEIWQIIGVLKTRAGTRFGFETTFVRLNLGATRNQRQSAWSTNQAFNLRVAITPFNEIKLYTNLETSREALGLAGYDQQQQKLWVYKRHLVFPKKYSDKAHFELNIPDSAYPINLKLLPTKPVYDPGLLARFRYYTISRMLASGTLELSGKKKTVSGQAFFDHSWGNFPSGAGQLVRNRFIVQLSNQIELILLRSRRRDGSGKPINTGIMIRPDFETLNLEHGELEIDATRYWTSPASGIRYPVEWQIRILDKAIVLNLKPWMHNQETHDFLVNWRGPISVSGHFGANSVDGFGHLQSSGYSAVKKNRPRG